MFGRTKGPSVAPAPSLEEAIDSAWRVHAALVEWTSMVDRKASFILALEAAGLAGVATATGAGGLLHKLGAGAEVLLFRLGVGFVLAGTAAAVVVVTPQLRWWRVKGEAKDNHIYFGHLRKREPPELTAALESSLILPMLALQLINMSTIAWRKHAALQISIAFSGVGAVLLGTAAALKADFFHNLF